MHDWVVWCKSKKGAEEIRSFELRGKEIFSNYDKTKSKEEKNKRTGAKRRNIAGGAYDTGRGGSKATSKWQRARIMLHAGFTNMSHCHNKTNSGFVNSSEGVGRKG